MRLVEKLHGGESGAHPSLGIPRPHAGNLKRHGDIGRHRAPGQQVIILEHRAQMPPVVRQLATPEATDIDAVDQNAPPAGYLQSEQQLQKGALAGTRVAGQERERTGGDGHRDVMQRLDARVEALGDVLKLDAFHAG